jgi:adenosylcobinamide-GDP ribazoletransferase
VSRPFALALVFLTRLPLPLWFNPQPADWGRSALYFPAVGLLIGGLLAVLHALLPTATAPALSAALLLTVWTGLTGALHLDGLADVTDAWVGGHGDRVRTLALMQDPRSGPMAIVALVLVLLLKFAALTTLAPGNAWPVLLTVPVLGRAALLLLLLTTPYVRPGGLGAVYADQLPRRAGGALLLAIGGGSLGLFGSRGVLLLGGLGVLYLTLRHRWVARLGGITGDTLGAACELTEAVALVLLALPIGVH